MRVIFITKMLKHILGGLLSALPFYLAGEVTVNSWVGHLSHDRDCIETQLVSHEEYRSKTLAKLKTLDPDSQAVKSVRASLASGEYDRRAVYHNGNDISADEARRTIAELNSRIRWWHDISPLQRIFHE